MTIDENTLAAYDAFAATVQKWSERPDRVHLEWPATRSLLPSVEGKRVLDAGCGVGDYSEWLIERGADVVAVDVAEETVERTRERLPDDAATVHRADLTEPLDYLDDESVDLVLSQLVLEHVRDWEPVFAEFYRVLRPGGAFVFSTGHPVSNWVNVDEAENFFETEVFVQQTDDLELTSYRRPLAAHVNPLADAGFVIERLLEPKPAPPFEDHDPERYEELTTVPRWEVIRARKPER